MKRFYSNSGQEICSDFINNIFLLQPFYTKFGLKGRTDIVHAFQAELSNDCRLNGNLWFKHEEHYCCGCG